MSEYVYAGLTSQTVDIFIRDSSSSVGAGLAGLVYNSASLVASYRKGATGARVAITLATQTVGGAWSSGGFVEIDATNMKGVYRFDLVNASVDTEGFTTLYLSGAANMVPVALRIDCRPLPVDVKKFGGTNLTAASGIPEVKVASMAANTLTAAAIAEDAGAELAALVETYIVNEGDATAVMQAIANLIAADWVAGDASPLAIAAAVRTNLATELARIDAAISTRLAAAGYTAPANSSIADIKTKTDQLTFTTALKVDATAELDSASRAAILTQQLIESYAADGAAPTVAQALMMLLQHHQQKSVSSTTVTVKKLDKSTSAATYTLDSATDPTSITRAT